MKIEVSAGDFFDRFSILQIKMAKIKDQEKIKNVANEFANMQFAAENESEFISAEVYNLLNELSATNLKIWEIEDKIRQKEKDKQFDEEFIQLARSVYQTNDKRAEIKKKINELTKSNFVEEKEYVKYG